MAVYDLAIRSGVVVSASRRVVADVYVQDGAIVRVGDPVAAARVDVDAAGRFVLPGMVDTHVHFMDPGDTSREDFPHGSAAAGARGVTTVIEHTHAHPIRSPQDLFDKRAYLLERSHVDFGLASHVWPDHLHHIPELWASGAAYFKIFTCTTHGVPGLGTAELRDACRSIADVGGRCLVHCEDEALTASDLQRLKAAGRSDPALLPEWRSRLAEVVAAQDVVAIVAETGVSATIAHASHPAILDIVRDGRAKGADITAEACPQYFLLHETDVIEHGALRKYTPPSRIRSDRDAERMWQLVHEGAFSHFSTDHAPATRLQKEQAGFWDAHFGLPGIDTTAPILIDRALRGYIALEDVVRLYSEQPARRYGLYPRKGSLEPGADADLVVVDPSSDSELSDSDIISKAGWTPYAGRWLQGSIEAVFLRGTRISSGGPAEGFNGRFLPGTGGR